MAKFKENILIQANGFLNSYAQVFFSDNKWLASLLIVVSFIDLNAGVAGAVAVLVSNFTALSMGYNHWLNRKGFYGYNSLLVGLGFGLTFQPGLAFYVLLIVAAMLTLFFTIATQGFFYKYGLPFLSIPFLFGIWLLMLSSGEFSSLGLSARGIFIHNELFAIGGKWLIDTVEQFNSAISNQAIRTYFFSLGAIFFQYNLLAGVLIAIGILVYSRIGFSLSVYGFFLAWLFYKITGADISTLGYSYIGFNYILTSMAIGGFFLIPSRWSYLWLIWLLPMVILVTFGLQRMFVFFQLGLYALPFNIVVLTFLYILKIRPRPGHRLIETPVQQFSPERNLYLLHTNSTRFHSPEYFPVGLPVIGEWTVSQAYHGEHTHKGEWGHALDFIITGKDGKQFKGEGVVAKDYLCYEKPVVAVADGIVADTVDGVDDNLIGENNVQKNWGNSVVIKHTDLLYTQVSHLKPGSIRVKKGEAVKRGDIIGLCGNSGRSPYPHLHFQAQSTPHIGSKTLHYPLANYLAVDDGLKELKTFSIPRLNEKVTALQNHPVIEKAFHFLPGRKMVFEVAGSTLSALNGQHLWEVKTDEYNNSFIECQRTGATAWFFNNGNIHYFTNYVGSRKSLLYYFYLGCYQVVTAFYPGLSISDKLPPDKVYKPPILFFHDFIAPFKMLLNPSFKLTYINIDEDFHSTSALLEATVNLSVGNEMVFRIGIANNSICTFHCQYQSFSFKAVCTES